MKKIRVYELAKELNIPAKEAVSELNELGFKITSHMAALDDESYQLAKEDLSKKLNSVEEKSEKEPAKKAENKKNADNEKKADTQKKEKSKQKSNSSKRNKQRHKQSKQKNKNASTNQASEEKQNKKQKEESDVTYIPASISVKDLAEAINVSVTQLISKLIQLGIMANQNQDVDFDTAELIADEFNKKVALKEPEEVKSDFDLDYEDAEETLKPRPPVITVMGHVDHGKTSLLDRIRKAHVTSGEAGGITQHIGAYTVNIDGNKIVFLDTPGHEAFTAMRSRGAQVTDIAILVVAADDGVMPQTIEAINHAKAAEVPIIVAVNKMDKPDANDARIKQELADNGLMPDEWGGDAIIVPVSAKTGDGIDDLLEMILMVSDMEEFKANPDRKAVGTIVEAQLDKGRGPTATVLVEKGTLRLGDEVVSGQASGRVRAMFDDKGKKIKKAGPSIPVLILGLSEVPEAGGKLYEVEDEKTARAYADRVRDVQREEMIHQGDNISLDDLFSKIEEGALKDLNIIVKTDVKGTIDAVRQSLNKLSNEEVKVNIIHGAVGGITDSDVMLATASKAVIIGFNVRPSQGAMDMAKHEGVDIRTYRVIYDAIEDVKNAIQGMLDPKFEEEVLGRATVRQVFKVPHIGNVAGVYVTNGKLTRQSTIRLIRDNVVVFEGDVSSMKRFKDDAKELLTGYEGGVGLENYNDIKEGDEMEAYIMSEVKR
mgnify:CR=1 FL=1